jgi:hypothetical protein
LRDALGDAVLALGREREHSAELHAGARRGIDPRIGVAEDGRAVPHAVVDVHVAVEIGEARTAPLLHVDGPLLAPEAKVGRDAERQPLQRPAVVFVVSGQGPGHGCPRTTLELNASGATLPSATDAVYMLI